MHQLLQAAERGRGVVPVGPLSPLFLDLRPTSTSGKKNTHIGTLGTAHHPRWPGFLEQQGG